MPVAMMNLCLNDQIAGTAAASADTLFTSLGNTQINAATVSSAHTVTVTVKFWICPYGSTPSSPAVDPIAVVSCASGATVIVSELIGHIVPTAGGLYASCNVTNVVRASASGVEFS
jgi:hypothetical protein